MMRLRRAHEIIESSENLEVFFNNDSVWLEDIDDKNNMVEVKILENNENFVVPVENLKETGRELK
ncbi:MAG: H-type small acid-soluble spore protein [Firmicutes bacterium]|nr:H-type small acid-soluble spore protein [Bacillota bacterium]